MIKKLITTEELIQGLDVLRELRPHLDTAAFLDIFQKMKQEGYELYAYYDDEEVMAVTGIITLTNFYDGYHIYVYDLVTKSNARSKGYGEKLLHFVEELARNKGCEKVTLSSGLARVDAHRFYEEKMNYDKASYVFRKDLNK